MYAESKEEVQDESTLDEQAILEAIESDALADALTDRSVPHNVDQTLRDAISRLLEKRWSARGAMFGFAPLVNHCCCSFCPLHGGHGQIAAYESTLSTTAGKEGEARQDAAKWTYHQVYAGTARFLGQCQAGAFSLKDESPVIQMLMRHMATWQDPTLTWDGVIESIRIVSEERKRMRVRVRGSNVCLSDLPAMRSGKAARR